MKSIALIALVVASAAFAQKPTQKFDTDVTVSIGFDKGMTGGMDPMQSVGPASAMGRRQVYETLIGYDPELNLVPVLATAWKYHSPTRLQFTLRQGVRFHDGTPFNAEAVVKNFEHQKSYEKASVPMRNAVKLVASVRAVGPNSVEYELSTPNYAFPHVLTGDFGMIISPKFLAGKPDLMIQAVGTGLYKLASFTPSTGGEYVRNDAHWNKQLVASTPARLQTRGIGDAQARLNGALSGDLTITLVNPEHAEAAKKGGLALSVPDTVAHYTIWLNPKRQPVFQKLQVRQALMYAIDRAAIAKGLTQNLGKPTVQMYPPSSPAYNPNYPASKFSYNPARSRQLLAEAGYPNGINISMMISTPSFDHSLAQAVQAQMQGAGIVAEVTPGTTAIFVSQQKFDVYLTAIQGRPDPLETIMQEVVAEAIMNPGHMEPPGQISSLIQQVKGLPLESPKRNQLLREISGLVTEHALNIPVLIPANVYVVHPCIVGFTAPLFGPPDLGSSRWAAGCRKKPG